MSRPNAWLCACVLLTCGVVPLLAQQTATTATNTNSAGVHTMKCRETGYTAKVNVIEVDDVPGHIIGVGEFPGVWSCNDGSVATTSTKDMFDYVKGSGKIHGYAVATFEDGSTLCITYQGTATPAVNGKTSRWEATCEFIKGTGRFEGVQGNGSFTGKRLASTPGAGAQYYVDYDLTYTLPSK